MLRPVRPLIMLLAVVVTLLGACAPPAKSGDGAATSPAATSPAATSSQGSTPSPRSGTPSSAAPRTNLDPVSGLRWIGMGDLPQGAKAVLARISQGGPFRSARDGATFGNRERLLPRAASGTYREYTVPTPGASDRGARRIVCAGPPDSVAQCYYTADHCATFRRIQP